METTEKLQYLNNLLEKKKMNYKKKKRSLELTGMVMIIIAYFLVAFMEAKVNFVDWSVGCRILCVLFWVVIYGGVVSITLIYKEEISDMEEKIEKLKLKS